MALPNFGTLALTRLKASAPTAGFEELERDEVEERGGDDGEGGKEILDPIDLEPLRTKQARGEKDATFCVESVDSQGRRICQWFRAEGLATWIGKEMAAGRPPTWNRQRLSDADVAQLREAYPEKFAPAPAPAPDTTLILPLAVRNEIDVYLNRHADDPEAYRNTIIPMMSLRNDLSGNATTASIDRVVQRIIAGRPVDIGPQLVCYLWKYMLEHFDHGLLHASTRGMDAVDAFIARPEVRPDERCLDSGTTLLHLAAKVPGRSWMIARLLRAGWSVDESDSYGNTALHKASEVWNYNTIELLVRSPLYRADVNAVNNAGITPLHFALRGNLRDHFDEQIRSVRQLLENGADVNRHTAYGTTPIGLAVQRAPKPTYDLLIEYGADVNALQNAGETVLHKLAVRLDRRARHLEIAEDLVARGVDPLAQDRLGQTALEKAENYETRLTLAVQALRRVTDAAGAARG